MKVNGKIRVLHVLPSIRGYGAERQIMALLSALRCEDIEPVLATIYEPEAEMRDALPFRVVSARRKNRGDLLFVWRLASEIRELRPDIVHTHTHVGKYWGRLAAVASGVRCIVHTEHNPCDVRRNAVERVADRLLRRPTSRVITFFSEQAECLSEVEGLPADKLAIIPNGLHLPESPAGERESARRALGLNAGDFGIVLVGRMEFQKNHALALQAIAALPVGVREICTLCFAGSGRDEDALRALVQQMGLGARVRFLGYRDDVPALLAGADAVLMTSWFEGMPLALIEAMIAGVAIVTTPWTGAANMLDNGRYGFLTAGFEPQMVAEGLLRIIERPQARKTVAERAHRFVYEHYGISRMIDAHRELYRTLHREHAS